MTHRSSVRAFLSAALLLAALPFGASAAESRSITVQAADLNLGSDAGRVVLRNRIDQAVAAVCGDVHMRAPWDVRARTISCSAAAHANAMSQFEAMVAAAQSNTKVAADIGIAQPVR